MEWWVNCHVQGQNDRFLPFLLKDSVLQPYGKLVQRSNHLPHEETACYMNAVRSQGKLLASIKLIL